ncbi:MAG: fumarylacetoacetate hydrolase family protein [Betaproteobacteria bacterium]|nr:fumarylacetoacetate hydrolase family protein [Betaproteobacteria bacterium]
MVKGLTLLSMLQKDGAETLGVKTPAGILDVRAAARGLKKSAPLTLDELLQGGNAAGLYNLIATAQQGSGPRFLVNESAITYGRLFQKPGKIVCIGLNYRNHAREIGMQPPRVPPLFNKYNNTLAAQHCTIQVPPKEISYKLDYETELLVVMGQSARNVSEDQALACVAGYCTGQDFSARDLQLELPNGQWMIGKTLDHFAPIGPYFVSADLVGNPNALKIETRVNGELRQSSNTSDFIFNTQQIIAYISRHFPLEPGDIIFTGTPEGVIQGKPVDQRVWLKAGDRVESSIEKLGTLQFSLV